MSRARTDCEMSKGQILRALVNECLTAAADEIFALVDRTIAEFEEELRQCKEENQNKHLLVSVQLFSPEPSLSQENPETRVIKEEPEERSVKQEEEEQLLEFDPVCVKSEDQSSLLQQTVRGEKKQDCGGAGGDIILDRHGQLQCGTEEQTENFFDSNKYREPPASSPPEKFTTHADHYNQDQMTRDTSTAAHNSSLFTVCAPETSATVRERRTGVEGGRRKYECSSCKKRFRVKQNLEIHTRTHTGERPYSCFLCKKAFIHVSHLNAHVKTHTGMKPYSCSICSKTFAQKGNMNVHMRTHTGERPYSCSVCEKTFAQRIHRDKHMRGNHSC